MSFQNAITKNSNIKEREDVYTEEFRPKDLNECVGQDKILPDFNNFIKNKDLPPAIILTGNAGLGKTTTGLILAHKIAGKGNTLYLDCSIYNTVEIMKKSVIDYMETHGKISQNLKVIILDEADKLSALSQETLRRSLEKYARFCRVIIICNYLRKIIEPIQSRCGNFIYVFAKIPRQDIIKRLRFIADKKSMNISNEDIEKITDMSKGDIRKAIITLNGIKKGAILKNLEVSNHDKDFIQLCLTGNYIKLRDYINNNIPDIRSLQDILKNSLDLIVDSSNEKFTNKEYGKELRSKIIELIGECENNLARNANHYISSLWLASRVFLTINKYTNHSVTNVNHETK